MIVPDTQNKTILFNLREIVKVWLFRDSICKSTEIVEKVTKRKDDFSFVVTIVESSVGFCS